VQLTPLDGPVGAEVRGAAALELAPEALQAALARHSLLVLRDQDLDPVALTALAGRLGEPERYPYAPALEGAEYVVAVTKEAHERDNFGGAWHSDSAYLERPPALTLLLARELPERGGDTLFADMYGAYASFSPGLKRTLCALQGVNTASLVHDPHGDHATVAGNRSGHGAEALLEAVHPLVRRHPVTGRPALFASLVHTARIDGLSRPESLPLLQMVTARAVRAEHVSRVRWAPGTLTIWDNRCLQHLPLNDYHGQRREMHRVIVRGEVPEAFAAPC
jgi:taurine dioxygenase